MAKVSIIVPIYNVEKYLDRCMSSLLSQSLYDIEIIMVDDGSVDSCPRKCDFFAAYDNRIKIIHKQNEGLGFARNSGLSKATGDYVAFVDSDDYVDNNMFKLLYEKAIEFDADVVFCGYKVEQKNGSWLDCHEVESTMVWKGMSVFDFLLDMIACSPNIKNERKYSMSVWHSIYKRSIIENNNIMFRSERDVASEDLPFQVDFLKHCNKVVHIPQPLYYYCLNQSSITATFKPDNFCRFKKLYSFLETELSNIEGAKIRINRLFIGHVRNWLVRMYINGYQDKKNMLKFVCDDEIWIKVSKSLNGVRLPYYPMIIYRLILHKKYKLLDYMFVLISKLKKR